MDKQQLRAMQRYFDTANYIAAIQIYLKDNFLLQEPLQPEHIKPKLMGHWGTCPGINFVYTHLNHQAKARTQDIMYIVGPGHGFAAVQANLFLEDTLSRFDPKASRDADGLAYITKQFCWPYGFPSHSSPGAPGVIVEGGELGYALSSAYGAVLDNPDLVCVCLVGDGEAETGPTAAAWHLNKLVNPHTNGVVLPILHLNEYKISGPTLFARMSDSELLHLFQGYGYQPVIVEYNGDDDAIWQAMHDAMNDAFASIESAKSRADGNPFHGPMIILKTPKGWTGVKELNGLQIEGNTPSHQVLCKNARTDEHERSVLESWLHSYQFMDKFDTTTGIDAAIIDTLPPAELRLGRRPEANPPYTPLALPPLADYACSATQSNADAANSMRQIGRYLREVFTLNADARNFRLYSPDETYSNRLDPVFEVTQRAFAWPIDPIDADMAPDGRVMEILSEHSLQGMLQGYLLTGRHGVFASYEAFIQIVSSMADQFIKFISSAREIPWRTDTPSLNYILTSSSWRQEHNGLSHQNPGFVDDILQRQYPLVRALFPYDANSAIVSMEQCLLSKNYVNIITVGKTEEPCWLSLDEARTHCEQGLGIWDFASDPDPDVVLTGIGDYMTKEALAAIALVKQDCPDYRIRFVNILDIARFNRGNMLNQFEFSEIFTLDKPVIFNFHGYPDTLKQLLFDYKVDQRTFTVNGYVERGSTTTAFDMQARNGTSRYDLAIQMLHIGQQQRRIDNADALIETYRQKLAQHKDYIVEHGEDPAEITNWQWPT